MIKEQERIYSILKKYFLELNRKQPGLKLSTKLLNAEIAEILAGPQSKSAAVLNEAAKVINKAEKSLVKDGILKIEKIDNKDSILTYHAPEHTKASKYAESSKTTVNILTEEQKQENDIYFSQLCLSISIPQVMHYEQKTGNEPILRV